MTYPTPAPGDSDARARLGFLLDSFCRDLPQVSYAIAVSGDGMPLATSSAVDSAVRDQICASTAGLVSITNGMAAFMQAGQMDNIVVTLDHGWVVVKRPSDRVVLTVLTSLNADLGQVHHELQRLGEACGQIFDPGARVPS